MNYIEYSFELNESVSMHNMREALVRIGEIDPMGVKRYYLLKSVQFLNVNLCRRNINEKDNLRRGILNVRKKINGNLGQCGMFSNNMINRMLFHNPKNSRVSGSRMHSIKIYYKQYIQIVRTIFELLESCDKDKANGLFTNALNDQTLSVLMRKPKGKEFKTAAPMQTHIILAGIGEQQYGEIFRGFQEKLKKELE